MLSWVKTGQVSQCQERQDRLGRSPITVTRWLAAYRQGGPSALLTKKKASGGIPKIQGEALTLKQPLAVVADFSSDDAIVD